MADDPGMLLTIIEAPPGWGDAEFVQVLALAGLVDEKTARAKRLREPPCLVGLCETRRARFVVDHVVRAGGDAMCCGMDAIAGLGATVKVKHFDVEPGVLVGTLWKGGAFRVALGDVQVLVRGNVRVARKRSAIHDADIGTFGAGYGGYQSEFSMVTHAQADAELERARSRSRGSTEISAKLDLHASDGTVYQIDGDKFAYLALGDMKTQGDVNNMDRLLDLLEHVCGNAVSDRVFDAFRGPPQLRRFRIPEMKRNNDDPLFAFYSRWIATVYRHVAGWVVGR